MKIKQLIYMLIVAILMPTTAGCAVKDDFDTPFKNMPEGFTITAHTGCMDTKDNSLDSIDKAVEFGAHIAEFDLRFFGDIPYLAHDYIKNVDGLISLETAFIHIQKYPKLRLNIDLKEFTRLDEVERLVKEYNLLDRVFYTGVSFARVATIKETSPLIPFYINVDFSKYNCTDPDYQAKVIEDALKENAIGINANFAFVTSELIEACRENNLLTSVWTVDKKEDMQNTILSRPDNITTRQPKQLRELLRSLEK